MRIIVVGKHLAKLGLSIASIYALYEAVMDFYDIAWGTGVWWGEFSFKWALIFAGFAIYALLCLLVIGFALWHTSILSTYAALLTKIRNRLGSLRWAFAIAILTLPIWLLQYSYWGVVLENVYLRLLLWSSTVVFLTCLITQDQTRAWNWPALLVSLLLTSAIFSLAGAFRGVTDYPFSLGWSEGNRLWDYSLLFGRDLYVYPPDKPPSAYLDFGRQLNGGLPFLLPHVTILQERLWLALMTILPYVLLGCIAFQIPQPHSKLLAVLAGLWAWMFLSQGPIHTPLLWCATLVAIAWRRPLWLALLLIMIASYFAMISRSTWLFAPAMWIGMLEIVSAPVEDFKLLGRRSWRAIVLSLSGLIVVYMAPILASLKLRAQNGAAVPVATGVDAVSTLATSVSNQPLLWYRLFPNATYGNGILLGLLIAVVPVIIVLVYLYASRTWALNIWQRLVIIFPLIAFLGVGLIVSTKIGGGGDLHNMDMFLIGVMFAAALAWRAGAAEWIASAERSPGWVRIVVLLAIALLGFVPLMNLWPISFAGDIGSIVKLADIKAPPVRPSLQSEELTRTLGSLPSAEMTSSTLEMIREYVREAQTRGEVLFMDQRQLLTFGNIRDVTLVPEYEKKVLMDKALSSNAAYFEPFYKDLAAHRFSLIISDPLRAPIKDNEYQFGEENNAWVEWVAVPVLCYYQPVETEKYTGVQLLIPAEIGIDCSKRLP